MLERLVAIALEGVSLVPLSITFSEGSVIATLTFASAQAQDAISVDVEQLVKVILSGYRAVIRNVPNSLPSVTSPLPLSASNDEESKRGQEEADGPDLIGLNLWLSFGGCVVVVGIVILVYTRMSSQSKRSVQVDGAGSNNNEAVGAHWADTIDALRVMHEGDEMGTFTNPLHAGDRGGVGGQPANPQPVVAGAPELAQALNLNWG